ncbi:MAG TPA: fumarylacetoacetate hydrolase family protein, partial [Actinomycetota bacterium]|nr:fumarylacetoacetate hydrolase family protein [Actinomycetota bacterium]
HPAFPTTMERLVRGNGGTVLDAARAALERDEAEACVVAGARLLAPVLPASLRSADALDGDRRVFGPGDEIPWPEGAGWLEFRPKIAAVLGRTPSEPLPPEGASAVVFGYTLVGDWLARSATGDPVPIPEGVPMSIGPCVVTADELDPQTTFVTVRVDGEEWVKGNLNGTAHALLREVVRISRTEPLQSGEAFAASPFDQPGLEQRLWPGAGVEIEAEGIGVLQNHLGQAR